MKISDSRIALTAPVRGRMTPLIRQSVVNRSDRDLWEGLTESPHTLDRLVPCRGREADRVCIDNSSSLPVHRAGESRYQEIARGKPMAIVDGSAQAAAIRPVCFDAVYYGDLIPTSDEHHRIIGCAQKEHVIKARYFIAHQIAYTSK